MTRPYYFSELTRAERPEDAHKGTFGRVLIVGGSVGMSGAVCLSATAALRGGAGLVTAAVPRSIQPIVASFEPSYTTIGLPVDSDGQLENLATSELQDWLAGRSVVAVGPGLGQQKSAADLVLSILKESDCPIVLDADALNVAAEYEMLRGGTGSQPCVLTPHPGEFSRLTGLSAAEINADRPGTAARYAADNKLVVVLKGQGTVVTDGERVYVNNTGNSGMATGGSGDVLTGLVAARIACGEPAFEAAVLAVRLHGLAGDIAAQRHSQEGMLSSDLLSTIGEAWKIL